MSSAETTLSVLRFLKSAYEHRWNPSAEQLSAWALLLADIPPEDLKRAAIVHANENEHPPSVADLRRHAKPNTAPCGDEAFDLARRAAAHASPYDDKRCLEAWKALEVKDPVAAAATRAFGGFATFWDMPSDQLPTYRAQFRTIYETMQKRGRIEQSQDHARRFLEGDFPGVNLSNGDGPRKLL